ncbi:hypothetical protein [Marisediminicola sp. LYQ134]|uniref:hypothetical protein n=1 Tax=unclassified Marisediminicola TaxID=2618316 RepID=UPI00398327B7
MRWDDLFDDLEGQLEHELFAEELDVRAEEERLRIGRLSLRDRVAGIRSAAGKHGSRIVRLLLCDGTAIDVAPATIGRDWLSADVAGDTSRRDQCIVPFSSIAGVVLSRERVVESISAPSTGREGPPDSLSARLTLSFVLRDLCRRRSTVEVRLRSGSAVGTIDRVGRDHLDLAIHERGVPRRESLVSEYRIVPFDQVVLVRV